LAEIYRSLSIFLVAEPIDTETAKPNPDASYKLPNGRTLSRSDEVITFVARSLEPYRGFHVFMRAVPDLLRRRPRAHVVIVGRDDVSYGRRPSEGSSWREVLLRELRDHVDLSRISSLGQLPYAEYLSVLQISSVHVYLTYPFVLSWSLLEAMACGCAIVGSATGPVLEVIEDGRNGRLVDFFDRKALVDTVSELLDDKAARERLGRSARATVVEQFDFKTRSLPAYQTLLDELVRWVGP
jgi:glycosyltransferase involved in cell wall biosynthesis